VLNETPRWRRTASRGAYPAQRAGMVVTVMDWGATLLCAAVPLADGSVREALLGCATPELYPPGRLSGRLRGPLCQPYRQQPFSLDGQSSTHAVKRGATSCTAARKGLISAAGRLSAPTTGSAVRADLA
jgi:hypothetical protein